MPRSKGPIHLVRRPHAHTVCGHYMPPLVRKHSLEDVNLPGPAVSCEVCLTVAVVWFVKRVWRGFGQRPPGPDASWELFWAIPESHRPRGFKPPWSL